MTLEKISQQILDSKTIVLMGHRGGDADCYGSLFGLKLGLESLGKKVEIISTEDFPESLSFLFFYFTGDIKGEFVAGADTFICLDASDMGRLVAPEIAKQYQAAGANFLHIDHHTLGDLAGMANYSFVDDQACSTSEIIYKLLVKLEAKIDKNAATCLLTGIIGDTSSYQNANTTESCFAVSSELMKLGARQRAVSNGMFGAREVDALKVWGLAMERLNENKQYGIVSTYLTYADIESFGLSPDVISGIVNYLNSIKGARVVMLIAEEERGTIKVSLRTRDAHVNVAALAKTFGGGGHIKAAGFSFPGTLKTLTDGVNNSIVIV